jgi:hypothetical protein
MEDGRGHGANSVEKPILTVQAIEPDQHISGRTTAYTARRFLEDF